jgi:hypothetical protein
MGAVFGMCVQIRVFCFDKDIDGGSALFHQSVRRSTRPLFAIHLATTES